MDDVHGARGKGSQRVVHPLDVGWRERRLAPCAQTTARRVARLRRDGDTLRAAPPRPRRADVLQETAMCFAEILADGNARRGGAVCRHRCRWRTLAGSISAARITSGARTARRARSTRRLFDDVSLEALHECDNVALLGLRHLALRQGRRGMAEEYFPVALTDTHTSVSERHVPAAIVHRSTGARA